MRKIVLGMVAATAATVAIPTAASAQPGYYGSAYGRGNYAHPYDFNRDGVVTQRELRRAQRSARNNSYNSYNSYGGGNYPQSYGGGYYPQSYGNQSYGNQYSRYYSQQGYYSGPTWRGNDGRYYCHRQDGSAGTIVGAGVGALIGSQVAGRGDRTLGAVLGGAVGALIGSRADRGGNNRYCR